MRILLIISVLFVSSKLFSQEISDHKFYNDISYDYGFFNSLNPGDKEGINGEVMNLRLSHFYNQNCGFRSGINFINGVEGTNKFLTIPVQFVYRSPINRSLVINTNAETIGGVLFDIILGIMPRQTEFFIGANLGYIDPDNNLGQTSIFGGPWITQGYQTEQRFYSSIDAGLTLKYKIRRFGIGFSPTLKYLVTRNFKYYSEDGINDGYTPNWFLSGTIGISYQF